MDNGGPSLDVCDEDVRGAGRVSVKDEASSPMREKKRERVGNMSLI